MEDKNFVPQGFSDTIFKDRYALTAEESWDEACLRVAKQMALAETPDKMKKYEDTFYDVLVKNLFVPGGRIWFQSGRNNPQLLNCFVLTNELDSKEGWGNIAREMIITSMTGGGCGIEYSDIRPNGSFVQGNKGTCPGPVTAMKMIDNCAEPVKSGGDRRVALMFSLDMNHPDLEEFLDAKLDHKELTHANVSVRCRNVAEFVKAVREDGELELSWKGQYKKKVSARKIWKKIYTNAWKNAEPGFLNWELALSESNIHYIEDLVTTNPCGEIALSSHDCCCLGHLVLFRFVNERGNDIEWSKLANTIRTGVRFLDNVLTVNNYPLKEMKDKSQKLRRIGLGVTGEADMLAMLGFKYGSDEANKFVDKLHRFISKIAYESSVMLAIEKGPFPLFNAEKHLESGFMKRMTAKIRALVAEHGIRNCAILTIAPTGTVSILCNNCSSGIEPMFAAAYERKYWKGKTRATEIVFHPLFAKLMREGKDVDICVGAHELDVREHMEMQKIVQKHIDNAVSKTINMAKNYPVEKMAEAWLDYLPYLKGTTFYRDGSRKFINKETGEEEEPPLTPLSLEEAIKKFKQIGDKAIEGAASTDSCKDGTCEI